MKTVLEMVRPLIVKMAYERTIDTIGVQQKDNCITVGVETKLYDNEELYIHRKRLVFKLIENKIKVRVEVQLLNAKGSKLKVDFYGLVFEVHDDISTALVNSLELEDAYKGIVTQVNEYNPNLARKKEYSRHGYKKAVIHMLNIMATPEVNLRVIKLNKRDFNLDFWIQSEGYLEEPLTRYNVTLNRKNKEVRVKEYYRDKVKETKNTMIDAVTYEQVVSAVVSLYEDRLFPYAVK